MNNKIYTDGSYRDGKGTFAIDIYNDIQRVKEITAICDANSSNKTELLAVLYALHQNKGVPANLYTDSKYVHDIANGNMKAKANKELWALYPQLKGDVNICYVKGHDKCLRNNRVDKRAHTKLKTIFR